RRIEARPRRGRSASGLEILRHLHVFRRETAAREQDQAETSARQSSSTPNCSLAEKAMICGTCNWLEILSTCAPRRLRESLSSLVATTITLRCKETAHWII